MIIAVGANTAGWREVLGMSIGPSEAETFWIDFLRKLARRGLRGVKLEVSDAHEGIKAAVAKVFNATWQRCRVHFMRNVLAHAGKQGCRVVSAFTQETNTAAHAQWRQVADQIRPRAHELAESMDAAEMDVLAYMDFAQAHRAKLHSTNPIVRARVRTHLSLVRASELEKGHLAAISMLGEAGHYNDADTKVHLWRIAAVSGALLQRGTGQSDRMARQRRGNDRIGGAHA